MLLAAQPRESALDFHREAHAENRLSSPRVEKTQGDQPPQGGIDAAEIPEVGLSTLDVHKLGDLAVLRLMSSQSFKAGCRALLKHCIPGERHADRAHSGVAGEDRGVPAGARPLAGSRRKDAVRR